MRRRNLISLLGSAAAAWPLVARGQQPGKVYRIGFVSAGSVQPFNKAFHDALEALGWIASQLLHFYNESQVS